MKNVTVVCDGCREECNYYIEIKDAVLKCANGRKISRSMGYAHLEIKDRHFCSPSCMIEWFHSNENRRDYYFPSEQIGNMTVKNEEMGK